MDNQKSQVTIRQAEDGDIPRLLELYRELGEIGHTTSQAELRRTPTQDDYRRLLAGIRSFPGYELVVAEYQGEVVGTMMIIVLPNLSHNGLPFALVENVVVDHGCRRNGVGKQLMDYAVARAREAGCHKVGLTSNKKRRGAHQFYRSLGFTASSYGFRLYF